MKALRILLLAMTGMFIACNLSPPRPSYNTLTDFSCGNGGWTNDGEVWKVESIGGNPNDNLHGNSITPGIDGFGFQIINKSTPGYTGDLRRYGKFMISIDIKVHSQIFFSTEVPRNLILELRDYDQPNNGYPYTSIWYNLGAISRAKNPNWTTYSVTVENPFSDSLPAGWGGFGNEDAMIRPILPMGKTFQGVLGSVDEISFSTFEPGFVYGDTFFFDLHIDNISFRAID